MIRTITARELFDEGLACPVNITARVRVVASHGTHEHDMAAAAFNHTWHNKAGEQRERGAVRLDHLLPV